MRRRDNGWIQNGLVRVAAQNASFVSSRFILLDTGMATNVHVCIPVCKLSWLSGVHKKSFVTSHLCHMRQNVIFGSFSTATVLLRMDARLVVPCRGSGSLGHDGDAQDPYDCGGKADLYQTRRCFLQ
jgi:hypothetical protein